MSESNVNLQDGGPSTAELPRPAVVRRQFLDERFFLLVAVFLAALAVRLAFCFIAIPKLGLALGPGNPDFRTSTDGYLFLARNLVDHGTFAFSPDSAPTTYRSPMYPWAIATVYFATRDLAFSVLLVNCVASSLTCVLIGALACFLLGRRVNFWLLLPVTLFPLSVYYCASSFSDTFCTFTFSAYFLSIMLIIRSPRPAPLDSLSPPPTSPAGRDAARPLTAIACGLTHAAACLTKAIAMPFPLAVLGYAVVWRRSAVKGVLCSMLLGYALIGLWTYRNWRVSGEFIPVAGGTGFNMLIGNFMIDHGGDADSSLKYGSQMAREHLWTADGIRVQPADLYVAGFLDVATWVDRLYGRAARRMWRDQPWLLPRKIVTNCLRFWYFSSSRAKSVANGVVNGAVFVLALLGMIRLRKTRPHEIGLFLLVSLLFVGSYAVIIVHSSRFALPLIMAMLPFALKPISDLFASPRAPVAGPALSTGGAP